MGVRLSDRYEDARPKECGFVALAGGGVGLLQRDRMKAALAEQPLGRLHQARARVAAPAGLVARRLFARGNRRAAGMFKFTRAGCVMRLIMEGEG
ncbi:MAG: hypothetical protein RLO08_03115 [Parvibaculaceae bacterium]